MAIITSNRPVPILEGGAGIGGTYSTEEGSRLTEKPKPVPSIKVRQPLLSEILTKVHGAKTKAQKDKLKKEYQTLQRGQYLAKFGIGINDSYGSSTSKLTTKTQYDPTEQLNIAVTGG